MKPTAENAADNAAGKVAKGRKGQQAAEEYLVRGGYTLLARNFKTRFAEIDLIMAHGAYIVFVEVKYRSGMAFGTPGAAVDFRKQQRIKQCSLAYIGKNNLYEKDFRYDVTEVLDMNGYLSINHIENAFWV